MNTATATTPNGPPPSPFLHIDPPTPEPLKVTPEPETVKVPLADLIQEEEPQNKSISFKQNSALEEHIALPTSKKAPPLTAVKSDYANKSTEELRKQMITEELQPIDEMSPEDFEMIAGFLIDAWDVGMVTLLRMYAMDTTDAPYEITASKKAKLKTLLSLILIRFNKKFPLGVLFIMTLILTSITPAMKAHAHRKEVQALNKKKPGPKKGTTKQKTKAKAAGPKPKPPADAASAVSSSNGAGPGVANPNDLLIPKKPQGAQPK